MNENQYYIYMLRCSDGSLYTGITTDPDRRLRQHNAGTGAKYTRSRRPAKLVWQEIAGTKSDALKREAAVKKLSRAEKEKLLQSRTEK